MRVIGGRSPSNPGVDGAEKTAGSVAGTVCARCFEKHIGSCSHTFNGGSVQDMGGGKDTFIGRNDDIPDGDGPIYVSFRACRIYFIFSAEKRLSISYVVMYVLHPTTGRSFSEVTCCTLEDRDIMYKTYLRIAFWVLHVNDKKRDADTVSMNPRGRRPLRYGFL